MSEPREHDRPSRRKRRRHRGPLRRLWSRRRKIRKRLGAPLAWGAATAALALLIWAVLRALNQPPRMP